MGVAANLWLVMLWGIAALSALLGLWGMMLGTSAIHQILTGVYFLTFTVAGAGIAIVSAIARLTKSN